MSDDGTAASLREEIQRLTILIEATKLINSAVEGRPLYDSILQVVRERMEVDRATLYFVNAATREVVAHIRREGSVESIRLPLGQGLAGAAASTGRTIITADAYADPRFDPATDQLTGFTSKSILTAPIRNRHGDVVGVLQLINKHYGAFHDKDAQFLESLSDHIAIAIENAAFHQTTLEKQRLESDLRLAAEIQSQLLSGPIPGLGGYEISTRWQSCLPVGGDYFDLVPTRPGELFLLIADVSGKGVAAALISAALQSAVRALVHEQRDLARLAGSVNRLIYDLAGGRKYATCFLGRLSNHELEYVNAGHNPPILAGTPLKLLEASGVPLGLFPRSEFGSRTVRLPLHANLVLYSDGITEASNAAQEEFGLERLSALATDGSDADALAESIMNATGAFGAGEPAGDDRTLMVIRRTA